ncbi:DUF2513 domain-containing protein [Bacteroidales bacterium MSK.15.36]|nr:DUF2513 domain-containing protein [Bacteroidales bacterium MSK.15.36]
MKLNPDCIRDILLTVEENTSYGKFMSYDTDTEYERLKTYSDKEVMYHIKQCELSNLITKVSYYMDGGCLIHDLSPKGHEFIANIRTDTNWNKTKDVANKVGSYSLDTLTKIASEVIASVITSTLGH